MAEVFDLAATKDSSLIGAIGEMIAWKHLRRRGIWAHRIGGWYPFPPNYPFRKGETNYELSGLNSMQVEYLKNMWLHGPRRYDFVGVKRKRGSHGFVGDVERVYLVEVKAKGPGNGRHDLRGQMKGKIPADVEAAKTLGFNVLLIIVELLNDWRCRVTCKEL